jgi:hypothetical protein
MNLFATLHFRVTSAHCMAMELAAVSHTDAAPLVGTGGSVPLRFDCQP